MRLPCLPCLQEVIAINQDDLGVPGDLIWRQGHKRVRQQQPGALGRGVTFGALPFPAMKWVTECVVVAE